MKNMSCTNKTCLYDKNHTIAICEKNGQVEERNLNITIVNFDDDLQIKLRDPLDYTFNYSEKMDMADFEMMRVNQNLDINFKEFKYHLIDMLQQFQKKQMFLKCETSDQKCTLIFYGKSKIKSIVFLTIDLRITNQKEIFSELIGHMQQIQDSNDRLKKQLSNIRNTISAKDEEIKQLDKIRTNIEANFVKNLRQIEDIFKVKLTEIQKTLTDKIIVTNKRLLKLSKDIDLLKKESIQKSDSNTRLLKTIENLRLDAAGKALLVDQLKKENNILQTVKLNHEKNFTDLRKALIDKEGAVIELQKRNEELRKDVEQTTAVLSQKKATIDELSKDVVQANQMLVNFNNHYDRKVKQVEELEATLLTKDKIVKEQRLRINDLLREFEEYKVNFNSETHEKLKHDLLMATNKNQELEKSIRKVNKINTLLTEKVNNQNMGFGK